MPGDITSANSVVTMVVPGLFPTPVQIQGYSADRAWNTDAVDIAEVMMGIDGLQSAGYVPNPIKQTWTIQADSASNSFFRTIAKNMKTNKTPYLISCTIVLPATNEAYVGVNGVLTNIKAIPDGGRVLQPVDYVISWQSLDSTIL